MIINVIRILLICSSIICVYSIACKNGIINNGKCECNIGFAGPDCSLRIIYLFPNNFN